MMEVVVVTGYKTCKSSSQIRMSSFWILLELSIMEVLVATGAIRRAKLQSNRHHQTTNTHLFHRPDIPFLSPTNSVKALKENMNTSLKANFETECPRCGRQTMCTK